MVGIDSDAKITEARKEEHLRIVTEQKVEWGSTWLDDVTLIHQSLPEISLDDVDTSTVFMNHKFTLPLNISGMTGGTQAAKRVNRGLAEAAQRCGISMGVGSQRVMLENPSLVDTFYVRDVAPNILLFANIGVYQLKRYSPEKIRGAIEAIKANALCVHLNPAQEIFQKDGDWDFTGCFDALRELCKAVGYPVIAKEVGHGISKETALMLKEAGVVAVDVQGNGGTSWAYIDSLRSGKDCTYFKAWGVPTGASVMEVRGLGLSVIGSGGIRSGADIAKCIALGADLAGIALPMLKAVNSGGVEGVVKYVEKLREELRYAMFLTGSRNIEELKKAKYVLTGKLADWARQRGLV